MKALFLSLVLTVSATSAWALGERNDSKVINCDCDPCKYAHPEWNCSTRTKAPTASTGSQGDEKDPDAAAALDAPVQQKK